MRAAEKAAVPIEALATRARLAGVPVIYVNDNFGRWRSDFAALVAECSRKERAGAAVTVRLQPAAGDYFVLKPAHSGFYETPLELLLQHLGVRTLVLCGFAANICVLFTANDAHMRGYNLCVPRDTTAANSPSLTRSALEHMRTVVQAETRAARHVDFAVLARKQMKTRGQAFRGDVLQ